MIRKSKWIVVYVFLFQKVLSDLRETWIEILYLCGVAFGKTTRFWKISQLMSELNKIVSAYIDQKSFYSEKDKINCDLIWIINTHPNS